ncbi:MAG TPA: methylenetetrahydrofolate reductase [Stellaceae bacterium]|nr:methylenetetrahydrofolate reductase [Stellaceae bacterium]
MTDPSSESPARSALEARLRAGDFVVTAELTPPVATEAPLLLERGKALEGLATAVNVTDGAGAKAHLSSLVAAKLLLDAGVEPILQMTCRDRNRLALQADLLGAIALGIRNVLVLSGDDPKAGDQPETKPVFDLDGRSLLAMADKMRRERRLPTGTEIKGNVDLVLGAADLPVDPPPGWDAKSLAAKLAAGADFVQTQFCMDVGVVRRYAARLRELGIAQRVGILIGVAPIPSARSARWMREKLFGTVIPEAIVTRLDGAADPAREGRAICAELLQELAEIPGIAGAHVMAPQNPSAIPEVIAAAGVTKRKRAEA